MTDLLGLLVQCWILATSAGSVLYMTRGGEENRRLGCFIGLAGQPCWFIETFSSHQWGMFLLAIFLSYRYLRGLWARPLSGV
jgi:hypothetical protein